MRDLFSRVAFALGIMMMAMLIVAPESKASDGNQIVVADNVSPPAIVVQATAVESSRDGAVVSDALDQSPTSPLTISLVGDAATGGSFTPTLESRPIPATGHPPRPQLE